MIINSIKRQIVLFGLVISVLFLAQVYMTMDPLKLLGSAAHRYEQTMEQETLLREVVTVTDKRHEVVDMLLQKADREALLELDDLQATMDSHVRHLKKSSTEEEWRAAYKTLQEIHGAMPKL